MRLACLTLVVALGVTSCADSTTATAGSSATAPTTAADTTIVTAPESERVDLGEPTFANPTAISNPLFPISDVTQVILLGHDEGETLRVEVTLLPETRTIDWDGQQVETVASHFVAYLDGRIAETAVDFFAQADDGSVWYFGEDVTNYEEGVVANHDGTWLAGKDGPPGMIMPDDPRPGDVYRPENIPGFVFEEVTVGSIGETVDGPRGPVTGAVIVQELLMDGTTEDKVFAPGYGEFRASTADELYHAAIAVPTDALDGPTPIALDAMSAGAADVFDRVAAGDFGGAATAAATLTSAWDAFRAGDVPELLAAQMTDAVDSLNDAIADEEAGATRQAAVDVLQATSDLELRHRPPAQVDIGRMRRWAHQLQADADAEDAAGVAGDVVVLEAIWDRVSHSADADQTAPVVAALDELRAAADAEDVSAAVAAAAALLDGLAL